MQEKYKSQGAVLLAVSLDDAESRARIPEYLKQYGIHCQVLLGEADRLEGYETGYLGMLYVVSREGLLAALPGDFPPDPRDQLESLLPGLLAGKPVKGRLIWEMERAPAGFGILWKQPLAGNVTALGVAPASKGHGAEIGLLDESHLRRYSASGEFLGEAPLDRQEFDSLVGADLEGNGIHEWIVHGENRIALLDSAAQEYWNYFSVADTLEVPGLADLDGNGSQEVILRDGSSVVAHKAIPGTLWKTPPLGSLKSVIPDPGGAFLVQTENGIQPLDRRGRLSGTPEKSSGDEILLARIQRHGGGRLDLFGSPFSPAPRIAANLTGEGEREIVIPGARDLAVFSENGERSLTLTFPGVVRPPRFALGNLDGRPGDEMILAIEGYGLVALGFPRAEKPASPAP